MQFKIAFVFLSIGVILILGSYLFSNKNSHISNLISPQIMQLISKDEGSHDINKIDLPSISIESIFSNDKSKLNDLPKDKTWVLIATGDIIPARSVNFQTISRNNFLWPYERTAEVLKSADITFANFETPIFNGCNLTNEGMIFCGDARHIDGLKYGGIDIVSLANNHAGNYGQRGVDETVNLMKSAGIDVTGINGPIYKDIKGTKVAFLGYNDIGHKEPWVSWADEERIKNEIAQAKKSADLVIVIYHWGVEYRSQPDERQKYLGRLTIDAGADLVIGNHPHWIQPIEIYKDKLITYAHGNFIFDQMWSQKTKEGVLGRYTFYGNKLVDVEYLPIQIENYGQPYFLEGQQKQRILDEMKLESMILSKQ